MADLAGTVFLSPVLSGYNGSPEHSFHPGNEAADELARRGVLLVHPPQFLAVSLLLSFVSTLVIFLVLEAYGLIEVSSTHRLPRFPPRNLCLPRHARCVLSRLRCNERSLLLSSYLSRDWQNRESFLQRLTNTRPRTLLISFCTVQLRTLRRSLFGDSLFLYDLWSRPWGVARLLGLHGLPPCPLSLGRGRVNTNRIYKIY